MPYRPGLTLHSDGVPISVDPGDFHAAFEHVLTMLELRRRGESDQAAQRGTAQRIGLGLRLLPAGHRLVAGERDDPRGPERARSTSTSAWWGRARSHATTLAQVAAAELGARFEDVQVMAGDTSLVPFRDGHRRQPRGRPTPVRRSRVPRVRCAPRPLAWAPSCWSARPRTSASRPARSSWRSLPTRSVPLGRVASAAVKSKAPQADGRAGAEPPAPTTTRTR